MTVSVAFAIAWVSVSVKVNGAWEVKNVIQSQAGDTFVTHRLTKDRFQGDETVQILVSILPTQALIAISCSKMKLNKNNKKCDTEHRSQTSSNPQCWGDRESYPRRPNFSK